MKLTKPQKQIYDMEKYAGGAIAVICGSMLIDGKKNKPDLVGAVREIFRLNDALRIRISKVNDDVFQTVGKYDEPDVETLFFENKSELDNYADDFAKVPLILTGELCVIKVVVLPEQYGILVKLHHMVGDAWTLSMIGTQFNRILNGEAVECYSYTDYIDNEQIYLQGKRYEKDKEFFLEQFKKCDEVIYLSEKKIETLNARRKTFIIDCKDTKLIADYVQQKNTSAFTLFTAALAAYINRTKMNAEKFYVGVAVLNRSGMKEKNTMGMFVNTVPMLIELDNDKSFEDNMLGIQKSAFSIFRHQKFNYGDVLTEIRKEYGFTERLYDVIISYQNASIIGEDIETTWYHSGSQNESLQIHIDDRDNKGIFRIHYDYSIEKFTEHEIDSIHEHLCNLLFDALKNDEKKIYELDVLPADEKQKLLFEFNDTAADYPRDKCIHQLFEEQAAKMPDDVAVIACDKTLTYDELNKLANKIANGLIKKGIGRNEIVAFALPRNSYLIAVIFGILKSGAAYLPIDLDYPQDRIDYMINDSNAKYFITDNNLNEFVADNEDNPNVEMLSDDYCYCIYTSGTTGKPKGTFIRHRNLANFCNSNERNNYQHSLVTNHVTRLISTSKCCFDAFGVDYALFLLNGLSLVLASDDEISSSVDLARLIDEHNVDVIQSTPSTIKALCENRNYIKAIKNAKIILSAAENFTLDLYIFLSQNSSAKVFNGYGPSETTIGASIGEITSCDITIGKPMANVQIYILDKYNNPVPIGQVGELCIAGDGVGAGYLNRPKLNDEKFVDNPFGCGKIYKTGDLAYWRKDGKIVYVGRNDFQVKIRGLRIELGEIEQAICSVKGISQAVVDVRKDENDRQLICAFYTEIERVEPKKIKTAISSKLPQYMMPHIFTVLDVMPLTANGKVNRNELPEVDLAKTDNRAKYVAPITEKERTICETIGDVLKNDKVGRLDNFFDLGGDSLKAIELISRLESKGYKTTVKTVFECETVKDLAEKIEPCAVRPYLFNFSEDILATDAQMRIYTAQETEGASTLYNVPFCFKTDSLDAYKLQNAINKLAERHDILRTYFENKEGHIIQLVDETAMVIAEELKSGNILDFIRPFDLSKAPLMRIGYYENTVMVDMHHIITDGSSIPVIFDELNELYMGRTLKDVAVQYREFAVEKKEHKASEKYWLSVFNDNVPHLEINTDFTRTQRLPHNGKALYDIIDTGLHDKIREKCRQLNITPYVFYMSGFNILLSKFGGNEDIVVGMPISGRQGKFIKTIGMFVNTIPLRSKPAGTKTVSEFLDEVKENSINAILYQDYPFGDMIKKLGVESRNRTPFFDVMFAYQSEQMSNIVFGDKRAELLPIPITTSKYDFTFNVLPRENDVVLMVEYCTDLYKESTIHRLIDGFKIILRGMLNESSLIKELSAITEEEKNKLLYEFNDTKVDYPADKCVHQLFEEQVIRTPEKTAVIACDRTLTYSELNAFSNRIANGLIDKGVKANDIVAFALPRNSYLIAVMFGILKAGAAYMPIDPNYPRERIQYMLEDSKAKLFITENNLDECLSENKENPKIYVDKKDAYCVIYTSGSTGKPKGCILQHKGIVNFCLNNNVVNYAEKEGINLVGASINNVTFDYFIAENIVLLLRGHTTILCSENECVSSALFKGVISNYKPNIIQTTPTKYKILMEGIKEYNKFKIFVSSGEALSEELCYILSEKLGGRVFNPLGPSECSVWDVGGEL